MIYILSDGKPGHLAQSRGLAEAIGRLTPSRVVEIGTGGRHAAPQPHGESGLILAAGRQTHAEALSLRKHLGVPAIAIMNPGWIGRQRFDLSIIPRHDGVGAAESVVVTEGAINGITPAADASPTEALLLIGGPSKHHHWEDESMLAQLHTLLARDTGLQWTATGSRRTPESTDKLLHQLVKEQGGRFAYTPAAETPHGWVAEQLGRCGVCWVSEDSVSMVFEALTAGARVGLLDVPRRSGKPGRVVHGVLSLVERGWVTTFDDWREGKPLPEDRPAINEADRVAKILLDRFPALAG